MKCDAVKATLKGELEASKDDLDALRDEISKAIEQKDASAIPGLLDKSKLLCADVKTVQTSVKSKKRQWL